MDRTKSVALVALVLLFLWGCLPHSAAAQPQDKTPIKIGALLPFSGGCELYGNQGKLGIDMAVKEINAGGGILGHPVEVIYADDKTRAPGAIEGAHNLIDKNGVLCVIGPITSQGLNSATPICEETKTPLLYATNYEGGKCSRYMFCFSTVPNQELERLMPYMCKNFGNKFFLFGSDRDWPHKMFAAVDPLIVKVGGEKVGQEYTLGLDKDYSPVISRIAASNAKVLVVAMKGDGLKQFITQADDQGLFKKLGVAFIGLSEVDLALFDGKGENMYVVVPMVGTSDKPSVKRFVEKVRAADPSNSVVSNFVMTHYNATMAIKAALEKAGKVDKEALVDALEGLKFQSPTGAVTIGKNHHATLDMFLAKTKGDALVTVKELGPIAPEPGCSETGKQVPTASR